MRVKGYGVAGEFLYEKNPTKVANEAQKEILSYITKGAALLYLSESELKLNRHVINQNAMDIRIYTDKENKSTHCCIIIIRKQLHSIVARNIYKKKGKIKMA